MRKLVRIFAYVKSIKNYDHENFKQRVTKEFERSLRVD